MTAPKTEYRWYEKYCAKRVLGICWNSEWKEHIETDFDFTIDADRKRFNDMGFDCSVRERPN